MIKSLLIDVLLKLYLIDHHIDGGDKLKVLNEFYRKLLTYVFDSNRRDAHFIDKVEQVKLVNLLKLADPFSNFIHFYKANRPLSASERSVSTSNR